MPPLPPPFLPHPSLPEERDAFRTLAIIIFPFVSSSEGVTVGLEEDSLSTEEPMPDEEEEETRESREELEDLAEMGWC